MTVNSAGILWRVTHPKSYGRNQLTVASDLAQKFDCNIIGFHEHHLSIGWDVYGRHVIVNAGGLMDRTKLDYVHLDDSRQASMVNGFCFLRGGVCTVLGKFPFTNWQEWV